MLWDKKWRGQRERLGHLTDLEKLNLALACVEHAYQRLNSSWSHIPGEKLDLVKNGLERLWMVVDSSQEFLPKQDDYPLNLLTSMEEQLEGIIPGDHDSEIRIRGWSDIINSVVYSIRCAKGIDPERQTYNVASYSYQSVYDYEMNDHIHHELNEDEAEAIELTCQVCQNEIDFQLSCLNKLESEHLRISKQDCQ